MGADPGAAVLPPVLSGHGFDRGGQVVLGNLTLAALHKRVGQTVEVSATGARQARLLIVGTATMPAFGGTGGAHMEMGSGPCSTTNWSVGSKEPLRPAPGRSQCHLDARPSRDKHGRGPTFDRRHRRETGWGTRWRAPLLGPQRPAEIIAYRNLGATPDLLGGALAAGAVIALGLTLAASVRRRRRDLALLNSLGFTNTQLAATIAWQSTVAVGTGTVAGVPWHRARPLAVGVVRPSNRRRTRPEHPRPLGGPRRCRCPVARQPGCRGPGAYRRPNPREPRSQDRIRATVAGPGPRPDQRP